jgi:hypothetical protein
MASPGCVQPATFGGWVEIASTNEGETGSIDMQPVVLVNPRKKACQSAVIMTANHKAAAFPQTIYACVPGRANWKSNDSGDEMDDRFECSDNFCQEVSTQDFVTNTRDFGGALASLTFTLVSPRSLGKTHQLRTKTRVGCRLNQLHPMNFYKSGWSGYKNSTIASSLSVN